MAPVRPKLSLNGDVRTKSRSVKLPAKKRRRLEYHSSSEDEEPIAAAPTAAPVNEPPEEQESDDGTESSKQDASSAAEAEASTTDLTDASSDSPSDSEASTQATSQKRKRNDPDAFATSISKILGSKLSTSKRVDPVLSRSKDAAQASKELTDQRLEARARHKMREDRRLALEKGRVKDVLGLESTDTSTAEILEHEKRLRKTAQRGVVKLFNAVRAAQVKGEEAARQARESGVVGVGKREERVTEMSKKGFLDLIAEGGKKSIMTLPEEA